jgi:hypothetical protein
VRSRRGRKTIGKQSTTLRILEVRRDGSKVKVRVGGMSSPAKSQKGKKTIGKSRTYPLFLLFYGLARVPLIHFVFLPYRLFT